MSRPLLLASLGNPGPQFAHTRHSAGHILLQALARNVGAPDLMKNKRYGNGPTSSKGPTTFWTSPDYMNVSGKNAAAAWRAFLADKQPEPLSSTIDAAAEPHLVIVHDELELPLGSFKLKTNAGTSARGHNGLKSLLSMPGMRELTFSRVGVGIGPRPVSRSPDQVANFVLGEMNAAERMKMEGLAGPVWEALEDLRSRQELGTTGGKKKKAMTGKGHQSHDHKTRESQDGLIETKQG